MPRGGIVTARPVQRRAFRQALALNLAWMNLSEVLRYFLVVRPLVRADLPMVPGIVPNTPAIGLSWMVWDLILIALTTSVCWQALVRYGPRRRIALLAASLVWALVFVLLWLALYNMGLARPRTIAAALPLAWFELAVAALLVRWRLRAALP